jgi:hypothetical protein
VFTLVDPSGSKRKFFPALQLLPTPKAVSPRQADLCRSGSSHASIEAIINNSVEEADR